MGDERSFDIQELFSLTPLSSGRMIVRRGRRFFAAFDTPELAWSTSHSPALGFDLRLYLSFMAGLCSIFLLLFVCLGVTKKGLLQPTCQLALTGNPEQRNDCSSPNCVLAVRIL